MSDKEFPYKGSIQEFLKAISLENHLSKFSDNKIEFNQLQQLSESDLVSIGINALGDRKKILEHIQNINTKEVNHNLRKHRTTNRRLLRLLMVSSLLLIFLYWMNVARLNPGSSSTTECIKLTIAVWTAGFIYMYPSYRAFKNVHQYRWGILLANVFFGVTVVVWFICLFVSFSLIGDKETAVLAYLGKDK